MLRAFAVVALLAVSVQLLILVRLHLAPTRYNPVRDAISDYGVGPQRKYFWAQLAAGALACTGVALALTRLHPYAPTALVALLLANAVARSVMPAFPPDQSGSRFATARGTIHMLLAFVAFGAVAAAATGLGGLFTHYPQWHGAKGLLETVGWVVLVGAVTTAVALLAPRLRRIFGLVERLFTLAVILWLYLISIDLLRFGK